MEKEALRALRKQFPKMQCLVCNAFKVLEKKCPKDKEPPCGRDFDPKNGGDGIWPEDWPIKPSPIPNVIMV